MKRVPLPPTSKRVPPPPAPKFQPKIQEQKQIQQSLLTQQKQQSQFFKNQQNIQTSNNVPPAQTKSFLPDFNQTQNQNTNQEVINDGMKVQQKNKNEIDQQVQQIQFAQKIEQTTIIQPIKTPIIKGVPPPVKSRTGASQNKKLNPPKIPAPNLISKIQKPLQEDEKVESQQINVINSVVSNQNQITQVNQLQSIKEESSRKEQPQKELNISDIEGKSYQKKRSQVKSNEKQKNVTERQQELENDRSLSKKQEKPFENEMMPQQFSQQPKQYNELEQKLRRLQQLRSKMDQSSEESYSKNEDEIEEEAEFEISQNQSQEEDKIKQQIFIQPQRNFDSQIVQTNNFKNNLQEFTIGETNFEQMEIQQENYDILPQSQTKNNNQQNKVIQQQKTIEESSPVQENLSLTPLPAQTIYESNLSVQESQRKYLPDQLSISPLNSESSMSKHHLLVHDSTNNVYHAQKHRSLANFDKPKINKNKSDQINQQFHNEGISQKSDHELSKLKNNEHNLKIKDLSIEPIYDKESFDRDNQKMKENKPLKSNLQRTEQKYKPKTTEKSIEQLLKQFNTKKSQYLKNIQNLKTKQEKFNEEETKYRLKISHLIQQINHKNLLILKHTTGLSDINTKNDNLIQTEQL